MPKYKAVVLDFDGVIVDSNGIKHQAFAEIFSRYPSKYDELMLFHKSKNHLNRTDKFRYVCANILMTSDPQRDAIKMSEEFTLKTREKIIKCPFIEGSLNFLESAKSRMPLYLASATPHEELSVILSSRGLDKYFKKFFGAPRLKAEMFSEIVSLESIKPFELLFIGDSCEDYESAKESGISFVGRKSDYGFERENIKVVNTLNEVDI